MKRFDFIRALILFGAVVSAAVVCGCHQSAGVSHILYPEEFSGTWYDAETGWAFIFEDGGTISHVRRVDGVVMDIAAGGSVQGDAEGEMYIHYVYGPCTWEFEKTGRRLSVEIVIDDFYVRALDAELSCSLIDAFEGPVSEDGLWSAEWTTVTKWHDDAPDQVISGRKVEFLKHDQ